jgi:hypothetical protein
LGLLTSSGLVFVFKLSPIYHLGRSESKLKDVLKAASFSTEIEGLEKNIPVVICDVSDPDSLAQMAKSTRLVNNP